MRFNAQTLSRHRRGRGPRTALLLASLLMLSACASTIPKPIRQPVAGDPGVAAVRSEPETAYRGQAVRWGGSIIETENHAQQTRITVLAQTLDSDGRPDGDQSGGRFIALVNGFLDPAVYQAGRLITVAGHIAGTETHLIGKYPYRYPVVQVDTYYLWPPLRHYDWRDAPPYWYDPYWGPYGYDPWYPYHGPGWPYPYW
ncbi:MAG: Slp family lipoprotein [Gammaproteobacteria bacterium]